MRSSTLVAVTLLAAVASLAQSQGPEQARVLIESGRTLDSLTARIVDSATNSLRRQAHSRRYTIPNAPRHNFLTSSGYSGVTMSWQDVRELMKGVRADVVFDVIASRKAGEIELAVARLVGVRGEPTPLRAIVGPTEVDVVTQLVRLIVADSAATKTPIRQPPDER